MDKLDNFFFQHRMSDNFRNKFINQLKFYANTFTHTYNGSTVDSTSIETSKFLNFDSRSDAPSLYITPRSMISRTKGSSFKKKSSGKLNKSSSDPKLHFYNNPSALSLLQKSKSNIKAEDEEPDEWGPTSDREYGEKLCPSLSKVASKIKSSSMNLLNTIEDTLCIKAKSPGCSGDEGGDDFEHMALPSLHNQHFADKEYHLQRRKVNTTWGVTRISVYDDNSRIIEIFKTSRQKPSTDCGKLEGVFVIGPHAM